MSLFHITHVPVEADGGLTVVRQAPGEIGGGVASGAGTESWHHRGFSSSHDMALRSGRGVSPQLIAGVPETGGGPLPIHGRDGWN